jgi:hypothetical protein
LADPEDGVEEKLLEDACEAEAIDQPVCDVISLRLITYESREKGDAHLYSAGDNHCTSYAVKPLKLPEVAVHR